MTNETHSYEDWKAELIRVTAEETKQDPSAIRINDVEAKSWYDDGWPAYYVFRENWGNECDSAI